MRSRWWSASTTPRGRTCTRRRPRPWRRPWPPHSPRALTGAAGPPVRARTRPRNRRPRRPPWPACTSRWPACRRSCRCSCGAAQGVGGQAAPHQLPRAGHAQRAGAVGRVRRTVCWNLAPDIPGYENPLSIMDLLFGKLVLMDYDGRELRHRHPSAATFALLAERVAGVEVDGVTRLEVPERPNLLAFEVRRPGGGRCWWCGSSATPSAGRTSRRWRSTGHGRQHGHRCRRARPGPAGGGARRPGEALGVAHSRVHRRRLTGRRTRHRSRAAHRAVQPGRRRPHREPRKPVQGSAAYQRSQWTIVSRGARAAGRKSVPMV